MAEGATAQERFALIQENLAEVMNPEIIEKILAEGRNPKIYWAGAIPRCRLRDDGPPRRYPLDNLKAPIELVEQRAKFYKFAITNILQAVGVSTEKLNFVLGSSYQKSPEYIMDIYKMSSLISERDAKKAGAEVVKQSDNAPMSGLLYPVLQVCDEQHLGVDAQFGGMDQRKLFAAATEWLPKIGYKVRAHLLNPMVPGLNGGKMSASDPDSKIDLLDAPEVVQKKLRKAECVPKVAEGNGVLSFVEYVLLPAAALKGKKEFTVERERDGLEPLVYTDIAAMHEDYKNDVVIDASAAEAGRHKGSQRALGTHPSFLPGFPGVAGRPYPPVEDDKKKKKKQPKDKGSRYPGGAKKEDGAAKETELPMRPAEESK
uniref:tyrosine--tRNA ligase n=1 Tax=Colletotrichum fructicola (strain Nara gc5) TaxID=1213859 RepID=L2G8Q4_COLFN